MPLVDRILTSRLLPAATTGKLHVTATRHRSTQVGKKQGRRVIPLKGYSRGTFSKTPPKFNISNPTLRARFLRVPNFIPWLVARLKSLAQDSKEIGFVTFTNNLIEILNKNALWTALANRDVPTQIRKEWRPSEQPKPLALIRSLQEAFASNGESGVDAQLKYTYDGLVAGHAFSKINHEDQEQLVDLRYPVEWYPGTRAVQRSFHLHVGPTNSGKTYHALKRLEKADSGIYAGPLRLLAHEVFTRLNGKGITCDLVTGDEMVVQPAGGARMKSCTVEMVPLNVKADVAVIDEIQMIGSRDRGWAWTQALLGLKAKEIHLCGEERSVPLIKELVASMGDSIEIHTYERLSPLKTMSTSLHGNLRNIRKGDCVVVFSRVGIHAMKTDIERLTQRRVAVVYGSLPPEIRAQQAKLFNDPDNDYDVLVASDAIGMGLNLAIKRIVFESVSKFDGRSYQILEAAHLKQIAGRAGRFRTAAQIETPEDPVQYPDVVHPISKKALLAMSTRNLGLVTSLDEADLPIVRRAMQSDLDPIMSAGIAPPVSIIAKFATYFPPSTPFSYVLLRLQELSIKQPRYHLCAMEDQIRIADIIQPCENLTITDRILLCAAPAGSTDARMGLILSAYARCVGDNSSGALLDIPEVPLDVLDEEIRPREGYMGRLEILHKALILYLWLSYRFPGVFINQDMAFYVKRLVEERMDQMLAEFSSSPAIRENIRKMKAEALRTAGSYNESAAEPASSGQAYIHDSSRLAGELSDEEQEFKDIRHGIKEQLRDIQLVDVADRRVSSP